MAKKTALLGMLVALAFVLSYIETLIPINLGIPGAKLGLANLVVMVALYTLEQRKHLHFPWCVSCSQGLHLVPWQRCFTVLPGDF